MLKINMKRKEFENQFKAFIGKRINRVIYYEVNYKDEKQYWNYNPSFDSLDFGLDLIMETDESFGIIWGKEFYQYGISLIKKSLRNELNQSKAIDVSTISRWKNLLYNEIESFQVIWSWVREVGLFKKKIYYPQDLVLNFKNQQKVYISALEIQENDAVMRMSDNLTIIFDSGTAKQYKVG